MGIFYGMQFPLSVETDDEKRRYFFAISHVELDLELAPANDVPLTSNERQESAAPPATNPPGPSPRVTWARGYTPPMPRSLLKKEPVIGRHRETANATMAWRTIRFFSAVFRVMIEEVGSKPDVVASARARLMGEDNVGIAQCAWAMPLDMVEKAVDNILQRRREGMLRQALVEAGGGIFERRRGSDPCWMLESEKMVKQRDSDIFYRRVDRFLDLEDVKARLGRDLEMTKGGVTVLNISPDGVLGR
ncbi:hypothetical protein B0I37DRAFT_431698 [Chaetomium sp. MPI-CAGE-AT-0009]|nr:hypothetical protein B0I37DRAFT_431698 [Chaetomium sp. MPI-CAGE-AT-0009]